MSKRKNRHGYQVAQLPRQNGDVAYAGTNSMGTRVLPPLPSQPTVIPAAVATPVKVIKIDLGCGSNKRQDNGPWLGVDSISFPGVDVVCDLAGGRWPWDDSTVTEAHASHFLEHLTNLNEKWERTHFFNELYRVLIPDGKCTIIIPHWCSNRYYGDPTHKEPWSEMAFYYLLREWRLGDPVKNLGANAPHADSKYNPNGYSCDFDATWGYTVHPAFQVRNAETQQFAFQWYKEAAQDIIATVTARK